MSVPVILGRKCTLATSRAAPDESVEYALYALLRVEKCGTDGRVDGRLTFTIYILTARRDQRKRQTNLKLTSLL